MPSTIVAMNSDVPVSFARTEFGTTIISNGIQRPKVIGIDGVVYTGGLDKPTVALTIGASGVGSITGTYYAYYRYKDNNRTHFSDFSPISASVAASSSAQIDYSVIPAVDPDGRATHVEVWRNTTGQQDVFYLDLTLTIGTTTGTSTKSDTTLAALTAIRIVNLDGTHGANRHGLPPSWKKVAIPHKDRMFYLVDLVYKCHCIVTNGSATLTGINTQFTSDMVGRDVYVKGVNAKYTVLSWTSTTVMTLTTNYTGTTDPFAQVTIRKDPVEATKVYFSEDLLPESVPQDQNFIKPQEHSRDWSAITGAAQLADFLLIFKERQIYRLWFVENPLFDGDLPMVSNRGCLNQNCWVAADDVIYAMDHKGIYAFDSNSSQAISLPIQDLFYLDGDTRINWEASDQFHATHDPQREEVRFFVCMFSDKYPRYALTFNYRLNRWFVDSYPQPIASSCTGGLGRKVIPFYGTSYARVAVGDQNHDLCSGDRIYGTVTSATHYSLSDTAASFSDVPVGCPVSIIDGPGVGQTRYASVVTATKMVFNTPWMIKPTTASKYQVGSVPWKVKFGKFRFTALPENVQHQVDVHFRPTTNAAWMHLRRYYDHLNTAIQHKLTYDRGDIGHADKDSADFEIDTKKVRDRGTNPGHVSYELGRTTDKRATSSRVVSLELRGFQGPDRPQIYRLELIGFQR
jgi:hypothetical protein